MLVDLAVLSYYHALRVQGWIGDLALRIEHEFFGDDAFTEMARKGFRRADRFAVEERVRQLSEQLMPLFDRANRMIIRNLKAIKELRQGRVPAIAIGRAEFVEAAAALGAGSSRIMARHILPNSMAEIIVQATFIFGYAVLDEATLSFLGVGPPPPAPSWGNMLAESRYLIREAFWISFFPGLMIGLAVLSTNILGDGIRDTYDVKRG
jgi:hypothetical protein